MDKVIKRNKLITNITSVLVFLAGLITCEVLFLKNIILEVIPSTPIGQEVKIPIVYTVFSVLFVAILFLLIIFGYKLKNKLMVCLSAGFQLVFVIGFVLFIVFSLGVSLDENMVNILLYVIALILAPICGFVWFAGIFSLVVLGALLIATVVIMFKVFKRNKTK